jgi:hypothetical protein
MLDILGQLHISYGSIPGFGLLVIPDAHQGAKVRPHRVVGVFIMPFQHAGRARAKLIILPASEGKDVENKTAALLGDETIWYSEERSQQEHESVECTDAWN